MSVPVDPNSLSMSQPQGLQIDAMYSPNSEQNPLQTNPQTIETPSTEGTTDPQYAQQNEDLKHFSEAENQLTKTQDQKSKAQEQEYTEWKKFQSSTDENFKQIQETNPNFKLEASNHKVRRVDERKSNPDHITSHQGNKVVSDSKYYAGGNAIPKRDYAKLQGDVCAQKAEGGVMIINENGRISEAFNKTWKNKKDQMAIIRLNEESPQGEQGASHESFNPRYVNKTNQDLIEKTFETMSQPVPQANVHLTQDGYIDERSKAVKQGKTSADEMKQQGVLFKKSDPEKVDGRCKAARADREFHRVKEERKNASNYDHQEAKKQHQEAKRQEKENKEQHSGEKNAQSVSDSKQSNKPQNESSSGQSGGKPSSKNSGRSSHKEGANKAKQKT